LRHEPYDLMFLAKHPSYEVALCLPTSAPTIQEAEHVVVRLRFKEPPDQPTIIFTLEAAENFAKALSRLMEYIRWERKRGEGPQSPLP
jgi:hypothetical protein